VDFEKWKKVGKEKLKLSELKTRGIYKNITTRLKP